MKRGIITITDAGIVTMPVLPVRMTQFEISDLFGVFSQSVRKAIHAIYKHGELSESETLQYVRQPDGTSYDTYNLEMIIALSFKLASPRSRLFRQYLVRQLLARKKENVIPAVYIVVRAVSPVWQDHRKKDLPS